MKANIKKTPKRTVRTILNSIGKQDFRIFLRPMADQIIFDVVENIRHQITPDNKPLKKNAESTIKDKKRRGIPNPNRSSLIDKHRLFISKETYMKRTTPKSLIVNIRPVRRKVGEYLHKMGYMFFQISPRMQKRAFETMRTMLKKAGKK